MKKLLLFIAFSTSFFFFAQKPIFVKAKVTTVNVYRNAAELQGSVNVNLPAGISEVVITNIADEIEEKSVQIGVNNKNVTILSSQFTTDYVSNFKMDKTNPRIKTVTDSIKLVESFLSKSNIELEATTKTLELLDKNQTVLVGSNTSNVTQLMQLTDYYKTKRVELSNNLVSIKERNASFQKRLDRLKSSIKINAEKEEQDAEGVLVVKVNTAIATNARLDIGYLSENASWTPFYEVKGVNLVQPLDFMFKGKVKQDTGLDWKGVKLTLINGKANQNNNAPTLHPWFLESYKNDNEVRNEPIARGNKSKKDTVQSKIIEEVVVTAVGYKIVENQLNMSFDTDIPYDIASNDEDHLINLKQIKIPAIYKYFVAPRSARDAFLVARISNFNQYNLIPGDASVIFENMYVGETRINPNQTTDELTITLGNDKKISVIKEIIDDKNSRKTFASSQEKIFTYDLVIRNNKKDIIEIEVKDQIPLSKDEAVKIELLESSKAEFDHEKGFLTWNVKLNPSEIKKIRVSYKVRYPKDYLISNLN
ncbi:DUF4139 domain-containing protein [Elizabethkingia ursingii]|uniref:DUF4139 domain-containing protein n=1 Tax=Elizabethkingia ursingii TaxID=1756150 RepID=UPI0020132A6B|nr:DUF4139 domain-containing protein [Elizabethkingia ursingii]MCL1665282.1 DUF4139 domain-containing protein [Elizabethkingia ursingii]